MAVDASPRRRRLVLLARAGVILAVLLPAIVVFGNDVGVALEDDAPSASHGTPANGRLENGKRLPDRGTNFRAYSHLGTALGRNHVHGQVRDAVLDAYAALARTQPPLRFVYGETGLANGGPMPPHKTHQNGLSVDFMVPVRDRKGSVALLPTSATNKFGYAHEFDARGRLGELAIDNAAIVAHLLALDAAARTHGLRIQRVIFDPPLQAAVFAAPEGAALRKRVPFSPKPSWIRHDEHYHVDFALVREPPRP
jgi:penicillin-insensitive murein endopeptidase